MPRESVRGQRADRDDGNARRDRGGRGDEALEVGVQVGLVENDDRRGAARPGRRQVSFDPAEVEIPVEAADEEYGIDVGRDDLGFGDPSRRFPDERAPARQDGFDEGPAAPAGFDGRPIADGRIVGRAERPMAEPARNLAGKLSVLRYERREIAGLFDDAGRPEAEADEGREASLERRVPSIIFQVHGVNIPLIGVRSLAGPVAFPEPRRQARRPLLSGDRPARSPEVLVRPLL